MPDLVCHLLPGLAAADFSSSTGPEAEPERQTAYIFRPVALKKVAHHPDGVLWPRQQPGGSEALPVVLLEVQMHADRRFHRRLGAETFRLLQQHEEVAHLQVLVLLAHQRLALWVPARPACWGVFSRRTSPGWIYRLSPANQISIPCWPCSPCRCKRSQLLDPARRAESLHVV